MSSILRLVEVRERDHGFDVDGGVADRAGAGRVVVGEAPAQAPGGQGVEALVGELETWGRGVELAADRVEAALGADRVGLEPGRSR